MLPNMVNFLKTTFLLKSAVFSIFPNMHKIKQATSRKILSVQKNCQNFSSPIHLAIMWNLIIYRSLVTVAPSSFIIYFFPTFSFISNRFVLSATVKIFLFFSTLFMLPPQISKPPCRKQHRCAIICSKIANVSTQQPRPVNDLDVVGRLVVQIVLYSAATIRSSK